MSVKAAALVILVSLLSAAFPVQAMAGRLNAYEWDLMVRLQAAQAAGDDAAMVPLLKELISIEEQYDDAGHWALDPNVGIRYEKAASAYGKTHSVLEYVEWGSQVPNGTLQSVIRMGVPLQLGTAAAAQGDQHAGVPEVRLGDEWGLDPVGQAA